MQGLQRQKEETSIQENKKLDEKVSIRKHNDWSLIIPTDVLYSDIENLERGKLKYYYEHWKNTPLTLSYFDIIKNVFKLEFNEILFQRCYKNFPLLKEERSIINSEIQKLKCKKVIVNIDKRTRMTFLTR